MSGWDETRRVTLTEPWQDFWVELLEDPPMGVWLDVQAACREAISNPGDIRAIETAIATFGPLVASHNITDRAGKPITEFSLRTLSSGLFRSLLLAVQRALAGAGSSPPSPGARKARSRAPSSRSPRSQRATPSGS